MSDSPPIDERKVLPISALGQNRYGERLAYLALAVICAVCITASLEHLADGGSQSKRDLHRFLVPLLGASVLLVACSFTSGSTKLGRIVRFCAIGAIVVAGLSAAPLLAMFTVLGLAAIFGAGGGGGSLLFLSGAGALAIAAALLVRSIRHRPDGA